MWLVSVAFAGPVEPPQASVPAAGRHEVVFDVARFGRYAVSVRSAQGAAVQVVDAMAGPGSYFGSPGSADGRVDLFLDRGEIKVVVLGDPSATGDAAVAVAPFVDAHATAPRLVEHKRVEATLSDLGQRSYWVDLPAATTVTLDAAGRYLGDLRLWRDGSWLVDAQPTCSTITPKEGQPWRRCGLTTVLEPGLYLVTAYGGPSEPWSQASDAAPMRLQWGGTPLSSAGRTPGVLGASGYDLYEIPPEVGTVHLALPDNAPAALSWGPDPSARTARAAITEESRRPTATVNPSGSGTRYVVVSGPPGQTYNLTWFKPGSAETTLPVGRWYVTTLHAADPLDVVDPTAVLYRMTPQKAVIRSAAQGLPVDRAHQIERSFNLAQRTVVLLDVTEAGSYRIEVEGVQAGLKFRPFVVPSAPAFQPVDRSTSLGVGLYELELTPSAPGVAKLRIVEDSLFGQAKRALGGTLPLAALRPAVQFPRVDAEAGLKLSIRPPPTVAWGTVIRELPIDPRDPLPITLIPGEQLELPITVEEPGTLYARAADGQPVPIAVDGAGLANSVHVEPGEHVVRVRDDRAKPLQLALALLTDQLAPERPLPALDAARLAGIPKFPVVSASAPRGLDLEAGRTATLSLALDGHGLYRIESTGLLSTHGAVRTRVTTRLASGSANGIGRNFLVAGYLRAGDYQLTVGTNAPSAGHLGVRIAKTRIDDGGTLPLGVEARATVPADAAVRYQFEVTEAGRYHLEHRSATGPFRCRVEDAGGWPIVAPDQLCALDLELTPGTYSVLGLPSDVGTRRLTTLERRALPETRQGHGPFALGIGAVERHVWVEPKAGEDRVPDVWTTTLAAPVYARVSLSAEMAAEIRAGGAGGEAIGRVVPGAGWSGELPAGEVRIEVRGARRGTGVPYTVSLSTTELVAGAVRTVSAPARIPVAVGAPGIYTFTSRGDTDLRARLVDADGRVVAANDDRPDDWNFQFSARLSPGRYELRLDRVASTPVQSSPPVSTPSYEPSYEEGRDTGGYEEPSYEEELSDTGTGEETYEEDTYEEPSYDEPSYDEYEVDRGPQPTTVEMRAPAEVAGEPLKGAAVTLTPGDHAIVLPVESRGDVIVARAHSGENVGIAIEVQEGPDGAWRPLADDTGRDPIAVARVKGLPARVRVWSEDLRGSPVEVRAETPNARGVGADALAAGVGGGATTAVLAQGGAGQFVLGADREGLFACEIVNGGCPPVQVPVVSGGDDGLVLVRVGGQIVARRAELTPGNPLAVRIGDQRETVGLASDGGVTVVTARAPAGSPVVALPKGLTAVIAGASAAVSFEGASAASLWDGASDPAELDARIVRYRVGPPDLRRAADGRTTVELPAHGAVVLQLDDPRRASVALDAGLLATFGALGAAWAEPGPTAARVDRVEGRIGLVNPTDEVRYAVVDLLPAEDLAPDRSASRSEPGSDPARSEGRKRGRGSSGPADPARARPAELVVGYPFERLEAEAGVRLIPVAGGAGVLRVRGAAEARYAGNDGRVVPADGVPVGSGGVLVLRTRPGPVLAWVEADARGGPLAVVRGPAPVELGDSGVAPLAGEAQRVIVRPGAGRVATLVVPCPAVAEVRVPGGHDRIEVLAAGDRLDLVAPQGEANVLVRALSGAALYGEATVSSAPIVPIGEGLGPEVLLGPGQAAFFSFRADRDGPVGVGVRADSGRVEATLMDPSGRPRARGVVAMDQLTAGTWLLAVAQPAGASPARVRPAVAGLTPPSTEPPEDVVRDYVRLAEQQR